MNQTEESRNLIELDIPSAYNTTEERDGYIYTSDRAEQNSLRDQFSLCPANLTKKMPSIAENDPGAKVNPGLAMPSIFIEKCADIAENLGNNNKFMNIPSADYCFNGKRGNMTKEEFEIHENLIDNFNRTLVEIDVFQYKIIMNEDEQVLERQSEKKELITTQMIKEGVGFVQFYEMLQKNSVEKFYNKYLGNFISPETY